MLLCGWGLGTRLTNEGCISSCLQSDQLPILHLHVTVGSLLPPQTQFPCVGRGHEGGDGATEERDHLLIVDSVRSDFSFLLCKRKTDTTTVEPLIKDTLNKGHLCIKDTF